MEERVAKYRQYLQDNHAIDIDTVDEYAELLDKVRSLSSRLLCDAAVSVGMGPSDQRFT